MKKIICILISLCMLFTLTSMAFATEPEFTKLQINYNVSKRTVTPRYINIHDTGNTNIYANAWMHYKYFNSGDKRSSADVFIDKNKIYQISDPDKFYTWAVGDNYNYHDKFDYNYNSINIEMCVCDRSLKARDIIVNKTILMTKYYMNKYKIQLKNVKRHWDVTHKPCPQTEPYKMVNLDKVETHWQWVDFLQRLKRAK